MRNRHDVNHISQLTFDEKSEAIRVKLHDTSVSIDLSADGGDSVTSHPTKLVASVSGCEVPDAGSDVIPALDCSMLREVRVDVEGSAEIVVLVSPTDKGPFFYPVGGQGKTHRICGRRIKVQLTSGTGNVYLVGRS